MDNPSVDWSDFSVPITLPELAITPTPMQLFMFSAATWNRHHIHYNRDAAVVEGLPDIVVQRALIGNFFVRHISSWLGDAGHIERISWKVLSSALPNQTLRCNGVVTGHEQAGGKHCLNCDLVMINERDETVAAGSAIVCIQEPSSAR